MLVPTAVAVLLMLATMGFAPTVMAAPYGAVSVASDQTTEPPADGDAPAPGTGELDEAATEQPAAEEPSDAPTDDPASSTEPAPTQPEQTETEPSPTETEPSPTEETETQKAQLSLQASMSPAVVSQDEIVTISVVVSNDGAAADTNVMVSNLLPAGAVFRSATDVAFDEQSAEATIGTVAANGSSSFSISVAFPQAVGEMVATPSVQGTASSDQTSSVVEVLPTVPGGPVSPEPSPAPSTSPDDSNGSGPGGGGSPDPAPATAGGPTPNGSAPSGGASDTGSGQGDSSSGGASPGDTSPGGDEPSGSTTNSSGQPGAGQLGSSGGAGSGPGGSGGGGFGPDGPGLDGPGQSAAGNAGGDARGGGDRSIQPAESEASAVPAASSPADGSTVVADPGADQIGPAWGQSAVHMLGVALVVTGCVLLAVGGARRNRFWS